MSPSLTKTRVERVRQLLREQSIDALLVSQPESRYYLSGYRGHDLPPRDSAGYLLISPDRLILLTDPRTSEQAASEAPEYEVVEIRGPVATTLPAITAESGLRSLGFEGIHLPYRLAREIGEALASSVEFRETVGLVDTLRIVKDAEEMAAMKRAIAVADDCVAHLLSWLRPGMTEKEVAWEVETFMRGRGAEDIAFDTIVASGPNAAMPHAVPTDRGLAPGEPITIDMGAKVDQYRSDITRTVCFGQPPDWLDEIYAIVLAAQERAEEQIRAGMGGREADAIARQAITDAGYGEFFRHSLGHGIGLEEHEPPSVSLRSEETLREGMVFSVEPGIYLPGKGGVRIEDLAWLAPAGLEVLTHAPKGKELLRI